MGILTKLAMLPLAPVGGVIWLAEQLEQRANEEMYGPRALRRRLSDLAAMEESGEISSEERRRAENEVLELLERDGTWRVQP